MTTIIDTDTAVVDTGAWFLTLDSMAITEVNGEDSKRFLQGQLSCNLLKLSEGNTLRGVLCNLKGRVIADVRVLSGDNAVLLISRSDLQEKILATLNKYRVFFKTSLRATGTQYCVYGIGGVNLAATVNALGISLPDIADSCVRVQGITLISMPMSSLYALPRFLLVFERSSEQSQALWQTLRSLLESVPESMWTMADIRAGQAHPDLSQSEVFTPQLLNYDINGAIDFKKGCYTGQEIVARMFYKADAKRRLYYMNTKLVPGSDESEGVCAPADDVVMSVSYADGTIESLVILNREQAEQMNHVFSFE
jgi:tRNA-modifying protein YgfZ